MAERKVLSKYYPPGFDPSVLAKRRKVQQVGPKLKTVRLMAPFSMRCLKCHDYVYKGRKFNARKETLEERYFSLPIYRFYICCPNCSAEICFRTDPKNTDYLVERGAKRNFEPKRATDGMSKEEEEAAIMARFAEEEGEESTGPVDRDVMAELEKKQLDAKTEMAIADALDEIRARNARNERAENRIDVAAATLKERHDDKRSREEAEDAEAARLAFAHRYTDELQVEELSSDGHSDSAGSEAADWVPTGKNSSRDEATDSSSPDSTEPEKAESLPKESLKRPLPVQEPKPAPPSIVDQQVDFSRKAKPKAKPLIKGLKPKAKKSNPLNLGY